MLAPLQLAVKALLCSLGPSSLAPTRPKRVAARLVVPCKVADALLCVFGGEALRFRARPSLGDCGGDAGGGEAEPVRSRFPTSSLTPG
eukprot:scaffold108946_cov17-Tisochrysis_lutea.AAC.1